MSDFTGETAKCLIGAGTAKLRELGLTKVFSMCQGYVVLDNPPRLIFNVRQNVTDLSAFLKLKGQKFKYTYEDEELVATFDYQICPTSYINAATRTEKCKNWVLFIYYSMIRLFRMWT